MTVARRSAWPVAAVGAISSGVFAILLVLQRSGATEVVDAPVEAWLDEHHASVFGALAAIGSFAGEVPVALLLTVALALLYRTRLGGSSWVAPFAIALIVPIELVSKQSLSHPPSIGEYWQSLLDALGADHDSPVHFPSGHAARAAFIAVAAAGPLTSRWIRLALIAVVTLTAFGRVYSGGHTVSEALGGVALGVAVGCVALVLARIVREPNARS